MRFTVYLEHPQKGWQVDLMRETALHQGDGITRGRAGVVVHKISEYGLGRLEAEMPKLIKRVERVE